MFYVRLLFILLLSNVLHATIYEDAEDRKTLRWTGLNNPFSSIKNLHDQHKSSNIISFSGAGTKSAYCLKIKSYHNKEHLLTWQMKFSEDFVIIVVVSTNLGKRYLVYTPGVFRGYMQYGLGLNTTNGKWQNYNRDLQKDLEYFDNRLKLMALDKFVVKGSGRVDNIETNLIAVTPRKSIPLLASERRMNPFTQPVFKKTGSLPKIRIIGKQTVQLNLGEEYIEKGVLAYDKEDGDLDVVSMENIDTGTDGRYTIMYMATDSDGNIALERRLIEVGLLKETEDDELNINVFEEEIDLLTMEEQVAAWEKKLALKEKELEEKEKNRNLRKNTKQ